MWLRFQTLLLAVCALLLSTLWWTDMCVAVDSFAADGSVNLVSIKFSDYLPFLILSIVCFSLSVGTIAYYSHRIIQIRLCIMNMLILSAYQIWMIIEFFKLKVAYTFKLPLLFPLVCVILLVLAIKYIWRDEANMILDGAIAAEAEKKNKKRNKKDRIKEEK
mgnify:CR=1 FL=1